MWGADLCGRVTLRRFLVMEPVIPASGRGCHRRRMNPTPHFLVLLPIADAFTHLRTGAPCKDRIGLLNVLLAEGINLGLNKMAEASNTHE